MAEHTVCTDSRELQPQQRLGSSLLVKIIPNLYLGSTFGLQAPISEGVVVWHLVSRLHRTAHAFAAEDGFNGKFQHDLDNCLDSSCNGKQPAGWQVDPDPKQ